MSGWRKIKGYEELPEGTWLVEVETERYRTLFHVAVKMPNLTFVGSCFHFDMPDIVAYHAIPKR